LLIQETKNPGKGNSDITFIVVSAFHKVLIYRLWSYHSLCLLLQLLNNSQCFVSTLHIFTTV